MLDIVDYQWQKLVRQQMTLPGGVSEVLDKVSRRETDPYSAAGLILDMVLSRGKNNP